MRKVLRLGTRPRATAPAVYAENFERVPESAAAARHLVSGALAAWRLEELADTATLVVTELVSNAVRHATGEGMRVGVMRIGGQRVRVAVLDRSRDRPQVQAPDPDAVRGRGLCIVSAESAQWGVDVLPGGKRVWADLEADR